MFTLLHSLLFISISICVPQTPKHEEVFNQYFVPRVVNGKPALLGDVPYQIALKSLSSRHYKIYSTFCGATLISQNKLITAAHCFDDKKKSIFAKCTGSDGLSKSKVEQSFAVAGNLLNVARYGPDSAENGQWRRLKSMHLHRGFQFPLRDIAVGFTRDSFVFNSNVGYIPYTTKYQEYNMSCLVSGYGRISLHDRSDKLMLAELEIIPNTRCSRIHRRNMEKFICTSDRFADVQKGDSGGPLVCRGTGDPKESSRGILVGVVSGHRARAGSFFTRVASFSKFVAEGRGTHISPNGIVIFMCAIIRWNAAILI